MKVAIIGAGICGLYLAWKLAERGEDVTVFEKKEKIGKEVCSGLFSERILEFIPHLSIEAHTPQKSNARQKGAGFIPESQKLIQNQINYCLIHFSKRTLEIKFAGKFFVMSHCELDRLVASLAEKSGAKIILNHSINFIPKGFDRIIGCDGYNSFVRKSLGLPYPNYRLAIQGFIQKPDFSDFVETWPQKEGFIWKIPRGNETEYGIIESPKGAKLLLEEFLEKNNLNLERTKSAIVSQGFVIPANPKITLCGDAAGLTKPWSGGGVVWSLIASNILLRNFPNFLKYKKETKKFFLSKIIFSKIVKKLVYFFGFKIPWLLPKNLKIEGDFLA